MDPLYFYWNVLPWRNLTLIASLIFIKNHLEHKLSWIWGPRPCDLSKQRGRTTWTDVPRLKLAGAVADRVSGCACEVGVFFTSSPGHTELRAPLGQNSSLLHGAPCVCHIVTTILHWAGQVDPADAIFSVHKAPCDIRLLQPPCVGRKAEPWGVRPTASFIQNLFMKLCVDTVETCPQESQVFWSIPGLFLTT